jgi:hypothetical protein
MALKYSPKVFLSFHLPSGETREGFFRQSQRLGDIIASFGVEGKAKLKKTKLDQGKTIAELGLKNDDVIEIK